MRYFSVFASLLALAVAGCVAPSEPPPPPTPPSPPPPPLRPAPLAADWRDWPLTAGTWRYEREARGTRAMFGTGSGDARLVLRCDLAARRLFLARAGAAVGALTVRTSSTTRAVGVKPVGGPTPYVASEHEPRDPLLDAIAFSRGRFVIEQAGAATLVVPVYAEIGRVIEDCRG
jgi:hypothetical protein